MTAAPAGVARRIWRALAKLLPILVALLFLGLLYNTLRTLDWADIQAALGRYRWPTLLAALGLAALVHGLASAYDLLGRRYERHDLPAPSCMGIAAIAYAVSISLSAILGTWVLRYRLYGRRGLAYAQITRLTLFAIVTNWSGFLLIAGLVFLFAPPLLPSSWPLGSSGLRILGGVFALVSLGYVAASLMCGDRQWRWRDTTLSLPAPALALLQVLLSATLWAALAGLMHRLLPSDVSYLQVMATLFISATAGLVVRVPAGVGVGELVFLTLLGPALGNATVIAAVLLYRCLYQLLPLAVASVGYASLEWAGKRLPAIPVAAR